MEIEAVYMVQTYKFYYFDAFLGGCIGL